MLRRRASLCSGQYSGQYSGQHSGLHWVLYPTLVFVMLLAPLAQPTPVSAQTSDSAQLVEKLYRSFVGRQPDNSEQAAGLALVDDNRWQDLMGQLAISEEWLGRFVDDTYQRTLNRNPDQSGRSYWISQLQSGLTTADIVYPILRSDEFANAYPANDNNISTNTVNQLFQQILGRDVDEAGATYWASVAQQHGAEVVADGLFASDEYRRNTVEQLYNLILCRDADEQGHTYWSSQLPRGGELELAKAITATTEFHTMNRLCTTNMNSVSSFTAAANEPPAPATASTIEGLDSSAYWAFWEEQNAQGEDPIRTRLLSPDRTKALTHDGTSVYMSLTNLETNTTQVLELVHSWLAANVLSNSGVVYRSYLFPGPSVVERYDPATATLTEIFASTTGANKVLSVSGDGESALLLLPGEPEPVQLWRTGTLTPVTSVIHGPWVSARMNTDGTMLTVTRVHADSLQYQTFDLVNDSAGPATDNQP